MISGTTAMLVAHILTRAAECRRNSIGWSWPGEWSAQDWKDSARSEIALARRLREVETPSQMPVGATHTYILKSGKVTWAKSYSCLDGMRFRARIWSLTDKCWGPRENIRLDRLQAL